MAVALARLGRPVRFATAYAADPHGAMVSDYLRPGVELASDPGAVEHRHCGRHDRQRRCRLLRVRPDLAAEPVPLEPPPVVVHTCSLGAVLEPGAADVVGMLERLRTSATVTYDINARPAITGTGPDLVARVERVAGLADVVRASDEDLAALWPAHDTSASVQHLLGLGPSAVVVTRGPDGATWTSTPARSRWTRCASRWPTRSRLATRSAQRSSTRSGSAATSADDWVRCRTRSRPRFSSTPFGRPRSRSLGQGGPAVAPRDVRRRR